MSHKLALASLALVLPLSGCVVAAVGTAASLGVTAAQEKTLGEAVDDATTGTQIKARLLAENTQKFQEVDVEVANGLVLLSGRVNDPEDRAKAEGIAWSASGAKDVANEIRIETPGGFIANLSDEVITGRVRSRLVGSKTVKSVNINVETYGGVVYLMGIARSQKELQQAATEASVVTGVRQVVSYMRVLSGAAVPGNLNSQGSTPSQISPGGTYETEIETGELSGGVY